MIWWRKSTEAFPFSRFRSRAYARFSPKLVLTNSQQISAWTNIFHASGIEIERRASPTITVVGALFAKFDKTFFVPEA